jgi:hypothetical protein
MSSLRREYRDTVMSMIQFLPIKPEVVSAKDTKARISTPLLTKCCATLPSPQQSLLLLQQSVSGACALNHQSVSGGMCIQSLKGENAYKLHTCLHDSWIRSRCEMVGLTLGTRLLICSLAWNTYKQSLRELTFMYIFTWQRPTVLVGLQCCSVCNDDNGCVDIGI